MLICHLYVLLGERLSLPLDDFLGVFLSSVEFRKFFILDTESLPSVCFAAMFSGSANYPTKKVFHFCEAQFIHFSFCESKNFLVVPILQRFYTSVFPKSFILHLSP